MSDVWVSGVRLTAEQVEWLNRQFEWLDPFLDDTTDAILRKVYGALPVEVPTP